MIDPAELREKITIQQKMEAAAGDRGQPKYVWSTFTTGYAAFSSLTPSDKEVLGGKQLVVIGDVMITIRYVSGVTEQMRVQDSYGTNYSILAILRGEGADRYFWARLHCREESGI